MTSPLARAADSDAGSRPRAAPGGPATRSRALAGLPLWLAIVVGAVGGVVDALAFPSLGWWPLIFVGTPLVLGALIGRRVGGALLVGLVAGFAFYGTHIFWLTIYLGAVPWLALAGLESVFYALGCVLIALAWRFGDARSPRAAVGGGVLPLVIAALWTLREQVSTTWPYGGFSWGRLAFSQSESPFGDLVSWVGVAGLSFVIAWISALLVVAARQRSVVRRALRVIPPAIAAGLLLLVPMFPVTVSGTARIAAVQGDADAGLFAGYTPGEILSDHLSATRPIFGQDVDLVVWPENASDLNPLEITEAANALDLVTSELRAPLVTGTITTDSSNRVFNSLLLWENGEGSVDQYDKIHPVPFAEYLPDREFWMPLAPSLFAMIPRDYSIGQRDNVMDIDTQGPLGDLAAGVAICFDIVDDALVQQMVDGGAEVILAPTNNADFGRSDESVQQLAIARLRAMETGRSVVNTSTVGVSAVIAPDGSTLDELPTFEPGTMVRDVPLSVTRTSAMTIGRPLETLISVGGLVALVLLSPRRRGRSSR